MKHDRWRIVRLASRTLAYAAIIGAVIWLFATRSGLAWAWHMAQPLLPRDLQVASVSGRLIGPITVKGVSYRSPDLHVTLQRAHMEWAPSRLLLADVDIASLTLHGLHVQRLGKTAHPTRSRSTGSHPLHLPVFLHLGRLRITDFTYQSSPHAKPWHFSSLALAARYDQSGASISDLRLQGPRLQASGHVHVASRDSRAVSGRLHWRLRLAGYAPVAGRTALSGNLGHLIVEQHIAAPYSLKAHVVVDQLLQAPRWRARLQVSGLHLSRVAKRLRPLVVSLTAQAYGGRKAATTQFNLALTSPHYGKFVLDAQARYHHQRIDLPAAQLRAPGRALKLNLKGRIDLAGTRRLRAQAQWKHLQWPLSGKAKFTSPAGRLNVEGTLHHLVAGLEARVGAGGRLHATFRRQNKFMQALLSWSQLGYPQDKPRWRSTNGNAQWSGNMDAYTLNAVANLALRKGHVAQVAVTGHGDRQAFTVKHLGLRGLGGRLQGSGRLAWRPTLAADITLHGSKLNPGLLKAAWPGRLGVDLSAAASLSHGALQAHIRQLHVQGRLRGKPFDLVAQGRLRNRELGLSRFRLISGGNRLTARGSVGRRKMNLRWSVDAPALAGLLPGAAGSLRGQGRVEGSAKRPSARVDVHADHLRYKAYRLSRLSLSGRVDMSGAQSSHLTLSVSGARVGGSEIRAATARLTGRPANQVLTLAVDSSRGRLQARLAGGVDASLTRWQGHLVRASVAPARLPAWQLQAPVPVRLSKSAMHLGQACWRSGSARLCFQGQRSAQASSGSFALHGLTMAYLHRLLPKAVTLRGTLTGHGHVSLPRGGTAQGTARLDLSNGALIEPAATGGHKRVIKLKTTTARVVLGKAGANVDAKVSLDQGEADLRLHMAAGKQKPSRRPVQGRLQLHLASLHFLTPFVPRIGDLQGQLHGDVTLAGTLARPQLDGQLRLAGGRLRVVPAGIELKGLSAQVKTRGHRFTVTAKADSGGGQMHIQANGELGAAQRLTAKVDGRRFQVMNTALASVRVSPKLSVQVQGRKIRVTGQVTVPYADITPRQLPQGSHAVTVSSDQVIVEPHAKGHAGGATGWQVSARVRVVLGNQVKFKGFGLKAQLGGSLLTEVSPGKPPSGSGQLVIRSGQYKAYGQDLTIKDGRILFAGPLDKPGVDVRATRKPQPGIMVGVHVKGPLKDPQFNLYSNPSMSQNQQLSWLVLGHSLSSSSGQSSAALAQAALALGIKGSHYLTGGLGKELGLNTLTIQSGTLVQSQAPTGSANPYARDQGQGTTASGQQASLMIGKYLSPRLYVSYGLGLLQQAYVLKLKYILSSKFTLQTEASSLASGVDLIYSIQRGNP